MTHNIVLRPIPRDAEFERLKKGTAAYRQAEWKRMCILCLKPATQMLCRDVDGATVVERLCDDCVSKTMNDAAASQSSGGT